MRPFLVHAAAAIALTLSALPVQAARSTQWTRSFDIVGRPSVRISTDDAKVRVHTRPGGPVEFRIEYDVHRMGFATSDRREPRIEFQQHGNAISLEVEEPKWLVSIASVQTRYSIDLTVPIDANVQVITGDGAIECAPLHGRTQLETRDGAIHADGLAGDIMLRSGDGAIEATALDGALSARAGDGRIRVEGRFDRLDVSTGDGRVQATARRGSKVSLTGWSLETRDGSLALRIPRDLAAFLDVRSNDGPVRVDLPIAGRGIVRRRDLSGELNGGGAPLRLRTGDGSLTLGLTP